MVFILVIRKVVSVEDNEIFDSVSVDSPVVSDPVPVDPTPEPLPAPEPVEPVSPPSLGMSPSDSAEVVVPPGTDSSVGGEDLPGDDVQQSGQELPGEDVQQPGEELPGEDMQQPGEELPAGDQQQPGAELPAEPAEDVQQPGFNFGDFYSNLPSLSPSQTLVNAPAELILDNVETYQLSPIEDSTGLKGVLLRIIGPYDNIVTQYRYQQSNNQYYTYVNEVTPDYPWIASAALFIALLLSLFGLLKRGMSWMK